ncbi:acetyl-CoA carboxylase, biotin carboxyl carrier protein, partial [Clavibacter californiensis]
GYLVRASVPTGRAPVAPPAPMPVPVDASIPAPTPEETRA